jgi:hypothetical protein
VVNNRRRVGRSFEHPKLLFLEMFRLSKHCVFQHYYFLPDVIVSNTLTQVVYFHYNGWL